MGAFLWRCVLCPSCDRYRWRDIAGVKAAEAERIVAVGSRRWKVKARLNLRVPQAVGRGAVVVDCCREKIRGVALSFTPVSP